MNTFQTLLHRGLLDAQNNQDLKKNPKLYSAIGSLRWRDRFASAKFFKLHFPTVNKTLQCQQLPGQTNPVLGTGISVWPAAVVLMKYLELNATELLVNRVVIELGTGTGAVGIAAAFLGAPRVIVTDQAPILDALTQHNVDTTTMSVTKVEVTELNWGYNNVMNHKVITSLTNEAVLVLVSDCVLPQLYPLEPLVDTIAALLLSSGSETKSSIALMSVEIRYYQHFNPKKEFCRLMETKGRFIVSTISSKLHHPEFKTNDIELWKIEFCAK